MLNNLILLVATSSQIGNIKVDDVFRSYIIPAIIAGSIAFLSMIISSIVTYKTTKAMIKGENERLKENLKGARDNDRVRLSAEYISNERIKWIQKIRESFAKFKACSLVAAMKLYNKEIPSSKDNYDISFQESLIELLLNYKGDRDNRIRGLLFNAVKELNNIKPKDEASLSKFKKCLEILTKEINIYLKIEWERVKKDIALETWTVEDEKIILSQSQNPDK